MEAEGLPRVRLAGARGSGKQEGGSQPPGATAGGSVLGDGCFAQKLLVLPAPHGMVAKVATRSPQGDAWGQLGKEQ